MSSSDHLRQAIAFAREGRKVEARDLLLGVVEEDPQNETAWMWLTGLVDALDDKIIACENILTINPSNDRVRAYLAQLLAEQNQLDRLKEAVVQVPQQLPVSEPLPQTTIEPVIPDWALARHYEMEGQYDKALEAYKTMAASVKDSREFDRLYKEIIRIEGLQKEKIAYVSPSSTIVRMAFGWPVLYTFLVLVQVGGKFFSYPAWYLWLGIPVVGFGSFLLALSEVNARSPIWRMLFQDENSRGTSYARFMASASGWLLILFPHLLLFSDSLARLHNFKVPVFPY
jgi:tetratricopeptide (TPR) repeat protein